MIVSFVGFVLPCQAFQNCVERFANGIVRSTIVDNMQGGQGNNSQVMAGLASQNEANL